MHTRKFVRLAITIGLSLFFLGTSSVFAMVPNPPEPTPVNTTLDALRQKAQQEGSVRVIVGLDIGTPFHPEGVRQNGSSKEGSSDKIKQAAAATQRVAISRAQSSLLSAMQVDKPQVTGKYKFVPYMSLKVSKDGLERLISSGKITTIEEDIPMRAVGDFEGVPLGGMHKPAELDSAISVIGADWVAADGYDGNGFSIAILDTGIQENNAFFSGRIDVDNEACFSNQGGSGDGASLCGDNVSSVQIGPGSADVDLADNCWDFGSILCDHGTHVAGIAAGNASGAPSAPGDGAAPNAMIIPIQVFTRFESTTDCGSSVPCVLTYPSDQMSALDYVYSLWVDQGLAIASVNMSLGSVTRYTSFCDSNSLKPSIDNLRSVGISTVIAAGNGGYHDGVSSPGCISTAVTVGSTNDLDQVASTSNTHPTMLDVFAPGEDITSSYPDDLWVTASGTSMAAPMVSGGIADIKTAMPHATASSILSALRSNGVPISVVGGSVPRIYLPDAIDSLINASVANDDFASAKVISSMPYSDQVDVTNATLDVTNDQIFDAPNCSSVGTPGDYTVWYRYTPSANGSLNIDTLASDYDTVLGVWTGPEGSQTLLDCNDDSVSTTSAITGLHVTGGTLYYIEAAGYDNSAWGMLNLHASFVPDEPPPTGPALVQKAPKIGKVYSKMPAFSWKKPPKTAGLVGGYQLQVARDSSFTSLVANVQTTPKKLSFKGLPLEYGVFYWRVRTLWANGTVSPWSAGWNFTVTALKSPKNGGPAKQLPTLSWRKIPGATSYELEIATDPNFNFTFFYLSGIPATKVRFVGTPFPFSTYYWRVRGNGGYGWTPTWSFHIP